VNKAAVPRLLRASGRSRGQDVGAAHPGARAARQNSCGGADDKRLNANKARRPDANAERDHGEPTMERTRLNQEGIAEVDQRRLPPRRSVRNRSEQRNEADRQHPLVENGGPRSAFTRTASLRSGTSSRTAEERREQQDPVLTRKPFTRDPRVELVRERSSGSRVDDEAEADSDDPIMKPVNIRASAMSSPKACTDCTTPDRS